MSFNRMHKRIVVFSCNGVLINNKNQGTTEACTEKIVSVRESNLLLFGLSSSVCYPQRDFPHPPASPQVESGTASSVLLLWYLTSAPLYHCAKPEHCEYMFSFLAKELLEVNHGLTHFSITNILSTAGHSVKTQSIFVKE